MKEQKIPKEIFRSNEDFFQGMRDDAIQQQIQGEARFLRGLLQLIHKSKSIGVFILGTGVAMFLFLIATLSFFLIVGAISAAIKGGEYSILIITVSVPGIFTFIFYSLSIKIMKNLFGVIGERSGAFQTKAVTIFFASAILTLIILFSILSSIINVHFTD